MADYAQLVFYGPKDVLASGNPLKLIRGTEIDAELDAISDAIATKADLSGDSILFADGTAGAPSISFASDPNTGFFRVGADNFRVTAGGSNVMGFLNTHIETFLQIQGADASAATPHFSFGNDPDTGIYRSGANTLGFAGAGVRGFQVDGGHAYMEDGTAGLPSLAFNSDIDTGVYKAGANAVGITAGGTRVTYFQNNAGVVQQFQASGAVTAPSYSFDADVDSGFYYVGTDQVGIAVGGARATYWRNNAGTLQQLSPSGAAGGPPYSFNADDTTGMFFVSAGRVAFSSAATEIFGYDSLANGGLYRRDGLGNQFSVGYMEIPQNAQAGNYTLVLSDSGKHIYHASGAGAGDTYTIPANGSVAYAIGTALTFINNDSNSVSIAITTDTMTLAGTTTTGTRTLAQNGVATAVKTTSTTWLISGTGLT